MTFLKNWKFDQWVVGMKDAHPNNKYDLSTYISLEIYPEDIEIFINILQPKIFEIGGRVFFDIRGDFEPIVRKNYENDDLPMSNPKKQRDWNSLDICSLFFNNQYNSSENTIMNIANLIKDNWEKHLFKHYPNEEFIVEIYGEHFEPLVTFYQK